MIENFLNAKHWQIFLMTFGLPFIIQILTAPMVFLGNDPMIMMRVFPVIMILCIGGLLGWFWSIGVGLQSEVPGNVKMKVKKFKILLITPLIYILLISIAMSTIFNGVFETVREPDTSLMGGLLGVIIPLHLFSMFCIFYCLYFVAKTFKTVELQREVTFSDFAGEFFLFWFFPVGIWIIQPKINKMIENEI